MKKITINKEEEIELTEREQEIYDQGYEDGTNDFDWTTFALGVASSLLGSFIIACILKALE